MVLSKIQNQKLMKFSNKKRILVTGGNGFLGNYIVKELLKAGHNITILTNKKTNRNPGVTLVVADITNKKTIMDKVKNVDVVYHVAGNLRTPATDTKKLHVAINAKGTRNLLEACRRHNINRFIFISTVEVYGDKKREHIKESSKKIPLNDYATSKLLAETYCKKYGKKYGITITVIRPSYIYGWGQYKGRLFAKLMRDSLLKKKTTLKPLPSGNDFVYVKDVASAAVFLGERKQSALFEDYNIASGRFTTIKEVFKTIKSLTGLEYESSHVPDKKIQKISFSMEKAKKAGYRPRFNLKKGLADYIGYQSLSLGGK